MAEKSSDNARNISFLALDDIKNILKKHYDEDTEIPAMVCPIRLRICEIPLRLDPFTDRNVSRNKNDDDDVGTGTSAFYVDTSGIWRWVWMCREVGDGVEIDIWDNRSGRVGERKVVTRDRLYDCWYGPSLCVSDDLGIAFVGTLEGILVGCTRDLIAACSEAGRHKNTDRFFPRSTTVRMTEGVRLLALSRRSQSRGCNYLAAVSGSKVLFGRVDRASATSFRIQDSVDFDSATCDPLCLAWEPNGERLLLLLRKKRTPQRCRIDVIQIMFAGASGKDTIPTLSQLSKVSLLHARESFCKTRQITLPSDARVCSLSWSFGSPSRVVCAADDATTVLIIDAQALSSHANGGLSEQRHMRFLQRADPGNAASTTKRAASASFCPPSPKDDGAKIDSVLFVSPEVSSKVFEDMSRSPRPTTFAINLEMYDSVVSDCHASGMYDDEMIEALDNMQDESRRAMYADMRWSCGGEGGGAIAWDPDGKVGFIAHSGSIVAIAKNLPDPNNKAYNLSGGDGTYSSRWTSWCACPWNTEAKTLTDILPRDPTDANAVRRWFTSLAISSSTDRTHLLATTSGGCFVVFRFSVSPVFDPNSIKDAIKDEIPFDRIPFSSGFVACAETTQSGSSTAEGAVSRMKKEFRALTTHIASPVKLNVRRSLKWHVDALQRRAERIAATLPNASAYFERSDRSLVALRDDSARAQRAVVKVGAVAELMGRDSYLRLKRERPLSSAWDQRLDALRRNEERVNAWNRSIREHIATFERTQMDARSDSRVETMLRIERARNIMETLREQLRAARELRDRIVSPTSFRNRDLGHKRSDITVDDEADDWVFVSTLSGAIQSENSSSVRKSRTDIANRVRKLFDRERNHTALPTKKAERSTCDATTLESASAMSISGIASFDGPVSGASMGDSTAFTF